MSPEKLSLLINLPFDPIWFVVVAFIMGMALAYGKNRRMILILSFLSTGFFALYNFMEVAFIGGYISTLSIANTAYQVSDDRLEDTKHKRFAIASIIGILGSALMINAGQDLLPLVAFLLVCYADTLSSKLRLLCIYLFTSYLWGTYALVYGDYWYAASNYLMIIPYAPRIWTLIKEHRDEKATKETHLTSQH
jgi:hypothetical protein